MLALPMPAPPMPVLPSKPVPPVSYRQAQTEHQTDSHTELTRTQLNAGIAQSLGWRYHWPHDYWMHPRHGSRPQPPDYCEDLATAWPLVTRVRAMAGSRGAERWSEFMESQRPEWCFLADDSLAQRFSRAFYYAVKARWVHLVDDDDYP